MIVDVSNQWKSDIIEFLFEAEKNGATFEDDFKLISNGRDITKLYLNKSLQGGYYRKYCSGEELAAKCN